MSDILIHAVALLNICDYSTRIGHVGPVKYVGAFYGEITAQERIVHHAFELVFDESTKSIDMPYFVNKDELYKTIYPNQELVGWFCVGYTEIEPWMIEVHERVGHIVENPVLGLFTVPFSSELSQIPLRTFVSNGISFSEVGVRMKVEETEQIALNDIFSSREFSNGAVSSQLSKQTKALLLYHKKLSAIKNFLDLTSQGKINPPPELLAKATTVVRLLNRPDLLTPQKEASEELLAEQAVLTEAITALMVRGEFILSNLRTHY